MKNKIRVLHIIKSLGRGGAEMLLPETLKLHDQDSFEFHYIYFLPWKNQMVDAIREAGGKVVCLEASNNAKILAGYRKISKYIREHNIQLVHCHLPWAGIAGRIAAKMAGVPVIYTEHNNFSTYHWITKLMSRLSFRWNDLVIPVSHDAESALKMEFGNKVKMQLVLNGVNTDFFLRTNEQDEKIKNILKLNEDTILIGTVAVFRKQKRMDRWLETAKIIHEKNKQTRFVIIGDGPEREALHQLARSLGLEDAIHFPGLITDVKPWVNLFDIYLMTSDFEGLPIALLEAMSMQCVPVATKVGGIPEVIEDHSNGLLSESMDANDIADLVLSVCHKDQFQKLGTAARGKILSQFSMRRMVTELEKIYRNYTMNA